MMRAGEESSPFFASSEALNYFRDALKLYLDRYGEKADPQKINAFKKNLALAHWSRGQFSEALPYFDDVLSSRNYTFPESKFAQRTRTVGHLIAIAVSLYSPVHFKTRFPSTEETKILKLLVKRGQCAYGLIFGVGWWNT